MACALQRLRPDGGSKMELHDLNQVNERTERRYPVCGRWLTWSELCHRSAASGDLDPEQYVSLFWDEA